MIPLRLKLSGFLSYRDPVEVDFSGFDLACISGQNGAGKSSLLDAMTWALFGQARKRDESVINLQSAAAEVSFTFEYENNQYRVIRSLVRGKTTTLEFQISDGSTWRPLTEHSNRETQGRIEQMLRLDYDTFINVSFFLQGRAISCFKLFNAQLKFVHIGFQAGILCALFRLLFTPDLNLIFQLGAFVQFCFSFSQCFLCRLQLSRQSNGY